MTVLVLLLGGAAVVLLFLLLMQYREIKSISKQLDEILSHETNELIHSKHSDLCAELINKVNHMLRIVSDTQMHYNRKSHEIEQMMTNISHDLRTPLTSAMGYINIVLNSDMSEAEKIKQISIVEQRLIRLEELINSFFEFYKVISEDNPPELQSVNLVGVLQESIVHYYDDFTAQNREVRLICDYTKIMISSNRNMLMRIFDNLIINAYKHSDSTLTVTVTQNDKICIRFENEVVDDDINTDRIFDEFYTTNTSRTGGHTGLGLAIAKQFTRLLGGKIASEYKSPVFSIYVTFDY